MPFYLDTFLSFFLTEKNKFFNIPCTQFLPGQVISRKIESHFVLMCPTRQPAGWNQETGCAFVFLHAEKRHEARLGIKVIEWHGLEGILKDHLVQPSCHEEGHFQLIHLVQALP